MGRVTSKSMTPTQVSLKLVVMWLAGSPLTVSRTAVRFPAQDRVATCAFDDRPDSLFVSELGVGSHDDLAGRDAAAPVGTRELTQFRWRLKGEIYGIV